MLKLIFLFVFILNFSAVFSDIISTDSNGNLIYDDEKVVLETELLDYYTTLEIDSQIDSLENQTENLENQTQSLWEELSDFFKYEDLLIYFYEKDEVYTRNETDLKINSLNETFENSTNELINTTQNLQDQIDVLDLNTFSGDYEELTNQPNLSIYTLNSDFIDLENNLENNYYDKPEIESQINVLDVELSDLRNMTETEYYTSDEVDEKVSNLESSITIDTNETLRVDELYDIVESLNNFSGDYDELDNAPELEKYDDALLDLEENYYTDDQVDEQINTLSDITQDLQTQINDIDLQSVNETSKIEDLDNKFTNENTTIWNELYNLATNEYNDTNLINQINEVDNSSINRDIDLENELNNISNQVNSLNNFSGDYRELTNQPNLSVYNYTSQIDDLQTQINNVEVYDDTNLTNLVNEINTNLTNEDSNLENDILDLSTNLDNNYYNMSEINEELLSYDKNFSDDFSGDYRELTNQPNLSVYNYTSQIEDLQTQINDVEVYDDTNLTNLVNEIDNNSINRDSQLEENLNNLTSRVNSLNNFSGDYRELTNQPNLSVYNQTDDINILNLTIQESVLSQNINRIYRGEDTLILSNQTGSLKIEIDFETTFESIPLLFLSFKDLETTNNTFSYSINNISQNNAIIILSENFDNTFENNVLIDWIIIE